MGHGQKAISGRRILCILAILEQNTGECVLFFIHVWRKDGFKGFITDTTLLDIFSDSISRTRIELYNGSHTAALLELS